jgi:hypothetical protein
VLHVVGHASERQATRADDEALADELCDGVHATGQTEGIAGGAEHRAEHTHGRLRDETAAEPRIQHTAAELRLAMIDETREQLVGHESVRLHPRQQVAFHRGVESGRRVGDHGSGPRR